jgi:hypothetical protein
MHHETLAVVRRRHMGENEHLHGRWILRRGRSIARIGHNLNEAREHFRLAKSIRTFPDGLSDLSA